MLCLCLVPHVEYSTQLRRAHPNEMVRMPPAKDRRTASAPTVASTSPQTAMSDFPPYDELESSPPTSAPSKLIREKNRLTLRAYLHSLMTSSTIASSPVLRSFLVSGRTTVSPEELQDAQKREEADQLREDGRKQFAREIASRVEGLRTAIKSVQGDIMGKGTPCTFLCLFFSESHIDGLARVFATVKATPDVRQLPPNYQAVLEWARISSVMF